jgi:AraC-like DNA-binding protein
MLISRLPRASLRPFVTRLWAGDFRTLQSPNFSAREHVLPTGGMHLAVRLSGQPLRLFNNPGDLCGRDVGYSVVGGARSRYYIRDVSTPSRSVGAMLRPGGAELLFGATAGELSERHTRLGDLWGPSADLVYQQLLEIDDPEQQLATLESILASRLPVVRGLHPAIAEAMQRFDSCDSVDAVVRSSGYSHRHFINLFRTAVGLTPKAYCRVLRFQKALQQGASQNNDSWASVAQDAGYSDQAHFNRDFLEFTGITPTAYRKIAPLFTNHLPLTSP